MQYLLIFFGPHAKGGHGHVRPVYTLVETLLLSTTDYRGVMNPHAIVIILSLKLFYSFIPS